MQLKRRDVLRFSGQITLAGIFGLQLNSASAAKEETDKAIADFAGGAAPESGKITLTAPEIAENGNTVPVSVSVESPMTEESYVESVMIVAEDNPNPEVATFHFSIDSGIAKASTRMRLAQTQNVIAVAKMNDGSVFMDSRNVKVTIGGCGG